MAARREWPPEHALRWTPRQRQVLDLIADGYTNGQIAEALGISFAGAKWHVSEVISRLGVSSREEAGRYWREAHGLRTKAKHTARAIFTIGAAKLVAGTAGLLAIAVATIAAVAIASGGDSGPGDEVVAQAATETAAPTDAAATATTSDATATSPTPVPTTTVPPGLDESVIRMIESSGVPLNRVTWVQETVEADGYALTLHGAYADTERTVAFTTAKPVDPDDPQAMPWINNISYALLTDGSGPEIAPRGSGGGWVREDATGGAMRFPALTRPGTHHVSIRYNELSGPHQQYVWSSWTFTFDLPVHSDTVLMPDLPPASGLQEGEVTFFLDSLVVSGYDVSFDWRVEGPEDLLFDEPRFPGIRNPVTPRVVAVGSSRLFGGGGGIGWDQPPGTTHGESHSTVDGPGDYEIVFGDPETSTIRWPFTIP